MNPDEFFSFSQEIGAEVGKKGGGETNGISMDRRDEGPRPSQKGKGLETGSSGGGTQPRKACVHSDTNGKT